LKAARSTFQLESHGLKLRRHCATRWFYSIFECKQVVHQLN
jgi:hypothetical protein